MSTDGSGKHFYPVGDEAHYQCVKGYKPLGPVVRQCLEDGRWSAKAPGWTRSNAHLNALKYNEKHLTTLVPGAKLQKNRVPTFLLIPKMTSLVGGWCLWGSLKGSVNGGLVPEVWWGLVKNV